MALSKSTIKKNNNSKNEINKNVKVIVNNFRPEKIVLFGSYARGESGPDSDIDLLVVIDTKRSTLDLAVEISSKLRHNFPLDIIVKTPHEIEKRLKFGDFFLKNIIENGKVLYERIV